MVTFYFQLIIEFRPKTIAVNFHVLKQTNNHVSSDLMINQMG